MPDRSVPAVATRRRRRLPSAGATAFGTVTAMSGFLVGMIVFGMGISIVHGRYVSERVAAIGITGIAFCTIAGFVCGAVVETRSERRLGHIRRRS